MRRIKRTVRIQRLHYTTIANPHYRKTANAPKIPAPADTTKMCRAQILKVTVAQYLQRARTKQEQQDLAYQAFQVNSTLIFAYKQLHHLIYTSCGRNTEEEFFAISETSFRDEAVCQRIKDTCGVEVSAKPDDENYMLVKLTDQAKVCKATTETGEMILDFPTLFKINHERRLLWQKYQNDFAKSCIDRCIVNLQNIRYKYLGIPRVITVRSQDNDVPFRDAIDFFPDNDTPFRDAIDFFPFLVEYCNLTAEQVFRLQENMNRLIAHANVEVWLASSPPYNMWIRITKNPS